VVGVRAETSAIATDASEQLSCPFGHHDAAKRPNYSQGSPKLRMGLFSSTPNPNKGSGPFTWRSDGLRRSPREEAVMKLLYPRCCALEVQQHVAVACLCLQDVDVLAHKKEVELTTSMVWYVIIPAAL
jgi:hypothetical protein